MRTRLSLFALRFACMTLFVVVCTQAHAEGPISPPKIEKGTFVYAIPDGFSPQGLSTQQQQHLQDQLSTLRKPFYVFVVENIPPLNAQQRAYADQNNFRGDAQTVHIETSTAMLMEDLAVLPKDTFDAEQSAVFVLSFSPRKFAWHPSPYAYDNAALHKKGQAPFTRLFIGKSQTRPAQYGAAIFELARAYDQAVFQRTDPDLIRERRERKKVWWMTGIFGGLALLIFGSIAVLLRKRSNEQLRTLRTLRHQYAKDLQSTQRVWAELFNDEAEHTLKTLRDSDGETRACWDELTRSAGSAKLNILAMQSLVSDMQDAYRARTRAFRVLRDLIERGREEHTIPAYTLTADILWTQHHSEIQFKPQSFSFYVHKGSEKALELYEQLKNATQQRQDFEPPHTTAETLRDWIQHAHTHDIPLKWLKTHPFGIDKASIQSAAETLQTLHDRDPIAYIKKADALHLKLHTFQDSTVPLLQSVETLQKTRVDNLPSTQLPTHPECDFASTLTKAQQAEQRALDLLQSSDDANNTRKAFERATALYTQAKEQRALVDKAEHHITSALNETSHLLYAAQEDIRAQRAELKTLHTAHVTQNTAPIRQRLETAKYALQSAENSYGEAQIFQKRDDPINALLSIQRTEEHCANVQDALEDAAANCAKLEQDRETYTSLLGELNDFYKVCKADLKRAGRPKTKLSRPKRPQRSKPFDYVRGLKDVQDAFEAWEDAVKKAQEDAGWKKLLNAAASSRAYTQSRPTYSSTYTSTSSSSSSSYGSDYDYGGSSDWGSDDSGGFSGSSGDF